MYCFSPIFIYFQQGDSIVVWRGERSQVGVCRLRGRAVVDKAILLALVATVIGPCLGAGLYMVLAGM